MMNGLRASVQHISVFEGLCDDALMDIIRTCTIVRYTPGAMIYDKGDRPDALYLVDRGTVRQLQVLPDGSTEALCTMESGDALGVLSFLAGTPRTCRAVAVSPCTLYRVDQERFNTLRANLHPSAYQFIRALSKVLTNHLREINQRIQTLQEDPMGTIEYLRCRKGRVKRGEGP